MKLFIIHGWTYSLDKWQKICVDLQSQNVEPILLKVPGLTEPSDEVWDIDGYIGWLDEQLAGQDKPVVVGHSNGGRIALSYAQQYPDKLAKMILIDSAGVAHQQIKSRSKLGILRIISKVGKALRLNRIRGVKPVFYKLIGARDYLEAPPNMKRTMQNMLEADKRINFSAIKLPITLIWGREDTITPLSDGYEMERALPNAKLLVINGARHAPQATHPEEVAKIIIDAIS